jgi:hypothetical protein
MVMKHAYGEEPDPQVPEVRAGQLPALAGRRRPIDEQPLYKVENQPYVYYRKGSLVMYRLQSELGEEVVNRALRKLIAEQRLQGRALCDHDRLPDLALRAEAPADKQALITDLFEKITLYDLKAKGAVVRKRADGRFDVTVTVDAQKKYADGKGKESGAPLNESMDIGLFLAEPGKKGFAAQDVVALRAPADPLGRADLHLHGGQGAEVRGDRPLQHGDRPQRRRQHGEGRGVSEGGGDPKMDAEALNAFLRRAFPEGGSKDQMAHRYVEVSSRGGCCCGLPYARHGSCGRAA